jgi:hypothetical protein
MSNDEFTRLRDEIIRAGHNAVRNAQKENLKMGIPNVYSRNGKLYYELPSGEITSETPDIYKNCDDLS